MIARRFQRTLLCFGLAVLLPVGPLRAGESSGAAFLKIGVGAKALGMGSAFTAVADDANAIYWNPGGLALVYGRELSAGYAPFIADMKLNSLAFAQPLAHGTLGLAITRLEAGSFQERDENRQKIGTESASDSAAVISIGRRFSPLFGVGLNAKYIQENIGRESARGMTFDAGVSYQPDFWGLRMGLALQNMGPSMHFANESFHLPAAMSAGVSYMLLKTFTLAADMKYFVYEHRTEIGSGIDYTPFRALSLRAGYSTLQAPGSISGNGSRINGDGLLSTFSGGIGVHVLRYQMDYSFVPMGEFGNTQRLNLSVHF